MLSSNRAGNGVLLLLLFLLPAISHCRAAPLHRKGKLADNIVITGPTAACCPRMGIKARLEGKKCTTVSKAQWSEEYYKSHTEAGLGHLLQWYVHTTTTASMQLSW